MNLDFSGRAVVVTGTTGELGSVVARRLIDAGATLHLPVRRAEGARELVERAPDRVRVAAGIELGDEPAVSAFYAGLPPLWASIHCAGGFAMSPVAETGLADFQKMMTTNAVSCFLTCREAVKKIRPREGR